MPPTTTGRCTDCSSLLAHERRREKRPRAKLAGEYFSASAADRPYLEDMRPQIERSIGARGYAFLVICFNATQGEAAVELKVSQPTVSRQVSRYLAKLAQDGVELPRRRRAVARKT